MRRYCSYVAIGLLLLGCTQRQEPVSPPWISQEDTLTTDEFDLTQIEQAGELIAVTLSGPETYYEFRGRQLGLHYLLCEQFAHHLGVKLRIETCRDTVELLSRLADGDVDLAAIDFSHDSLTPGWLLGSNKLELNEALTSWYEPSMLSSTRQLEKQLLSQPRVHRRIFAPMLSSGVISRYDALFKLYSKRIGWDWRLLAAQCYQESTFDPNASSWAGAQGLMQIMPQTADHLGLARTDLNKPEPNIEAAVRYLKELDREFSGIRDRQERQNLMLAAYNGGIHHVRDAMRLAERDGFNPNRWTDVRTYILRLAEPRYYQDTLVHYGYMRGNETADYVDKIRQRYQQYRKKVRP